CNATGMSNASAPTLFMNAESTAATPVNAPMVSVGPAAAGRINFAATSTAPELCNPRLKISTHATVTTAGCPKPANTSPVGNNPVSAQANNAAIATTS